MSKRLIKNFILVSAFVFVASPALALTIQSLGTVNQSIGIEYRLGINVGSSGVNDAPDAAAGPMLDTIALDPAHPGWFGPLGDSSWISFVNNFTPTTGVDGEPGDLIQNDDFVWFFHAFKIDGSPLGGQLEVLADDTVSVWVNGTQLATANGPTSGGTLYPTCSPDVVGCIEATLGTFDLASHLVSGSNLFAFQVFQRAGTGFGLNYSANVDVPEPATMLLMGAGLLGLRRRLFA